ncbi:MAG: hypothetical protein SGJ18_06105 [Pseudomonadota bacterium]|nr:hypothetical protein [Pseudomonadota bacterium]
MLKGFSLLFSLLVCLESVASSTATLHISGSIPPKCSVFILPSPKAYNLNIRGGERRSRIAIVNEVANTINGYQVQISSLNGGKLINGEAPGGSTVPYQISYDGKGFMQPSQSQVAVKTVSFLEEPISHNSDLLIHIPPQPHLAAGSYEDTLTIQISSP